MTGIPALPSRHKDSQTRGRTYMAGLRIFETDPSAKPKPRQFADDFVGRFRTGRQVNNRPEQLSTFRITTGDPSIADAVSKLYGGKPSEWETSGEDHNEVITEADKVLVVIDGPAALTADMKLWGRSGLIHHCDGVEFLSPDEDKGQPCGCPALMEDRKAQAKSGRGPQPNTNLVFRLADDYHLGKFRFQSTSWKLAEVIHEIDEALSRHKGEVLAELSLELVEFTTKSGRDVSYRKPVVKVLKPWADAVADDADTDY
ncbi:recombination directionality factor [Streptomyces phage Shady]|uniref:Recombination directionality factor n=1 Tax=Streptomyces phage Shady TaxID=2767585 RepID=A0A873WE82_9CAUD|nr:recombination directionality factor [Streptomyces phage Shady]